MRDRIIAVVDSRFVTRVGNVGTLLKMAGVGAVIVIAVVATIAQVLPLRWWMPLACFVVWFAMTTVIVVSWRRNVDHRRLRSDRWGSRPARTQPL